MSYKSSDKSIFAYKLTENPEKYRVEWNIWVDGIGTFIGEEDTDSVFEIPKMIYRIFVSVLTHIKIQYLLDAKKLCTENNRIADKGNKIIAEIAKVKKLPLSSVQQLPRILVRKKKGYSPPGNR